MTGTPWAEYERLAEEIRGGRPHHGEGGNVGDVSALPFTPLTPQAHPTGSDAQYNELAKTRDYTGDPALASDPRAFIESLGVKFIPHTSGQTGPLRYAGGRELESGAFWHHLAYHEECLRQWQEVDGEELYPETVCLAGLYHSVYGTQVRAALTHGESQQVGWGLGGSSPPRRTLTAALPPSPQGFQAFQFPIERRAEIAAIIGERGERAAYYTCAMDRASFQSMVLANKGLRRGETPRGSFSGRRNHPVWLLAQTLRIQLPVAWQNWRLQCWRCVGGRGCGRTRGRRR